MGAGYHGKVLLANDRWDDVDAFYTIAHWRLRFLWRPKRSAITGRWLWLCRVYEGTAMWTGLGSELTPDAIVKFRYHEPTEHIIWQLKGNYNGNI